jgi:hypothetical protein
MTVCEFAKMQAFGRNGTTPVHMLSTADASMPQMHVVRQHGITKLQLPSLLTGPMYNDGMQGVDRHYQL